MVNNAGSYPPVLGADNQQAALSKSTERNTLTALTVDGFGLFFKHRVQVLNTHTTNKLEPDPIHQSIFEIEKIGHGISGNDLILDIYRNCIGENIFKVHSSIIIIFKCSIIVIAIL